MCKHKHKTVTQALGDDGLFAVEQCDMCGMLGDGADVDTRGLPAIDMMALEENIRIKIDKLFTLFADRPLRRAA